MKSAEELAKSAFEWAENQAKQIQASIDAGNLEGEALEDAKTKIAQFEELKQSFNESKKFCSTKNFSAENTEEVESENALDFALIRKLVITLADDGEVHDELFEAIKNTLIECGKDPNILTSVINHVAKLKGIDYSEPDDECYAVFDQLVTEEIQDQVDNMEVTTDNILDLIKANCSKVIKFAGEDADGMALIESGKGFLEQIKDRIMSSEDPDMDQVAEYDKAINALDKFIKDESVEVKNFAADIIVPEGTEIEVVGNCQDIRFSKGDESVTLCICKDMDGNIKCAYHDQIEIPANEINQYVEDQLNDPEISVEVDPDTGDTI